MSKSTLGVVILAAGQGTRMRSALPKVLHPVCGVPMARHVIDAARYLDPSKLVVVVGYEAERVREALRADDVIFVEQPRVLGTGDAVKRCRDELAGCDDVMVLNGDCPLIQADLLHELVEARSGGKPLAFTTALVDEPGRLGRVLRDPEGHPVRIVEAADWEGEGGPAEINAGQYVFDADWLWAHIDRLRPSAKGEYYLTDLIAMASSERTPGVTVTASAEDILGVDDRIRLAQAEQIMRHRILERHMLAGVTISDPSSTYIEAGVRLAQDVTVLPSCHLQGNSEVGTNSIVGPGTTLRSARIGQETTVQSSVIEDSTIGNHVRVGPFAHVRGGSVIEDDCELGNYSEVKNSHVGRGVKMHHFSYVGDAEVGEYSNIAAGAITCNWDGVAKHRTTIGARVFIGCDTMLVAPISLGDDALTGAGSVVTRDVPPGGRVAGVPARPIPRGQS